MWRTEDFWSEIYLDTPGFNQDKLGERGTRVMAATTSECWGETRLAEEKTLGTNC